MGFMRRKSVAAADTEDVRPRNRLSKPMTSKSPTSQRSSTGKRSPKSLSQSTSTSSQLTLDELTRSLSKTESRAQAKSHLFEGGHETTSIPNAKDVPKKIGVASLVKQFESAASTSQTSLAAPVLPPRPTLSSYGSRRLTEIQQQQHIQNIRSNEKLRLHKDSVSTLLSPSDSLEQLTDPFAIPKRRESKYRPGDATRKSSAEDKENQPPVVVETPTAGTDKALPIILNEPDFEQEQEQWTPPPTIGRTDTPSNLEFKAIGNLRLGSLHVVNGRQSPVLSELSRHLISQQLRVPSSVYADSTHSGDAESATWEDDEVNEDEEDMDKEVAEPAVHDLPISEDKRPFTPIEGPQTPLRFTPVQSQTPIRSPDRTSMMAEDYMRELQASPFSYGSVSPASAGSVIHHPDRAEISPPQTPDNEKEDRRSSLVSEQPSLISKLSEHGTVSTRDHVFSSALEYQAPVFQPPPSPERGVSPESVRTEFTNKPYDRVDSGYGSGNSMMSLNLNETRMKSMQTPLEVTIPEVPVPSHKIEQDSSPISLKKHSSPRKLGRFFPIRPAAPKSPASTPTVPTVATSRPLSVAASVTLPISTKMTDSTMIVAGNMDVNASKLPRKLQKQSKPRSQSKVRKPNEIVVQQLPVCESTLDLPAISDVAKANLERRSLQIPELEKTYSSHDRIRNEPSISSLTVPPTNIRFPTPNLESDDETSSRSRKKDRSRSKSRPRSKSRRRSFMDMFRSEKETTKRNAEARKEETQMSITDFGDVIASLGSNPYDIAHSRPHTPDSFVRANGGPRMNPHNISINRPRQRTSMTDQEASEYARRRSLSFNGHGDKVDRKLIPDEHGGIAAKLLRRSLVEEVPPIPPMPSEGELRRISQRHSMQSPGVTTPNQVRKMWAQSPSSNREYESSPAPLPPAHSPKPSFVDHKYEEHYAVDDEIELAPPPPSHSPVPRDIPPPPPPSHSPRPMHVMPGQSDNPWDAQARAWKQRRMSAGEALRNHRHSLGSGGECYEADAVFDDDDAQVYPVIPPREPGQHDWAEDEGQWLAEHQQVNGHHHESYPQRSQTWDVEVHDPYHFAQQRQYHSQASFQSRNQHYPVRADGQNGHYNQIPISQQAPREQRQPYYRAAGSSDSQQSFYSHRNCPIDRPFDQQQHYVDDLEDEYGRGYGGQFYSPQHSNVRGHGAQQPAYQYNGYENDFYPAFDNGYPSSRQYPGSQHDSNYIQPSPQHYPPQNHHHNYRPTSRSPQPLPHRSGDKSSRQRSPLPSRPSSRQSQKSYRSVASMRSTGSAVSLAEELHPEINKRPSQAPDFGRYSGGMGFGYEGRDKGFGGSAGTRSVSGKADAMFKGTGLRETHGVDLGDIPVNLIAKRI